MFNLKNLLKRMLPSKVIGVPGLREEDYPGPRVGKCTNRFVSNKRVKARRKRRYQAMRTQRLRA
jgi:hypothetical protein